MARNREERYQNARGLQTALEEIQAASGKKMTSAGLTQLLAGVSAARKRPSRAPKALPDAQQLPIPSAADDVSAPLPTDPGPPFFGPTAPEPPATFEDTTEKLALPLRPDPPNPTLEQPQSVALDERTIVEQRPEPTEATVSERQISRGDLEQASVPAEPPTRGPLRAVVLAFVIGGCIAAAALGVWLTRRQSPATVPTATTAEP
jgi:hypothetical protein